VAQAPIGHDSEAMPEIYISVGREALEKATAALLNGLIRTLLITSNSLCKSLIHCTSRRGYEDDEKLIYQLPTHSGKLAVLLGAPDAVARGPVQGSAITCSTNLSFALQSGHVRSCGESLSVTTPPSI
jgi:hypothetical protein